MKSIPMDPITQGITQCQSEITLARKKNRFQQWPKLHLGYSGESAAHRGERKGRRAGAKRQKDGTYKYNQKGLATVCARSPKGRGAQARQDLREGETTPSFKRKGEEKLVEKGKTSPAKMKTISVPPE